MTLAALELRLEPLPVLRTATLGASVLTDGLVLQMPDGSVVSHDDPLLAAFGSVVTDVFGPDAEDEGLQSDAFDPGRPVRLLSEGVDDDGDEIVAVWDADVRYRAGTLDYRLAARVSAAEEHGLQLQAVLLSEQRTRRDDRRCALKVFIAPTALVTIRAAATTARVPRKGRARPRLVLVADGRADLRWWDPTASTGPIPLADVPVSADLSAELVRLGRAYAAAVPAGEEPDGPLEALEEGWARDALYSRVRAVWTRARAELGRSYAVGLLAPGMTRPAWSPGELDEEDGDDFPF